MVPNCGGVNAVPPFMALLRFAVISVIAWATRATARRCKGAQGTRSADWACVQIETLLDIGLAVADPHLKDVEARPERPADQGTLATGSCALTGARPRRKGSPQFGQDVGCDTTRPYVALS